MATEVNILFQGILLFLTNKNRVIMGVPPKIITNCGKTVNIPQHYPYVAYTINQSTTGATNSFKDNGREAAIPIKGLINIVADTIETAITYPNTNPPLPNVVVTNAVAPGYTPLPTVMVDAPAQIDPSVVAVRVDLPFGTFRTPIPTDSLFHFFPQKTTSPVIMSIAQCVVLTLNVKDDQIKVTQTPFQTNQPADVVTLRPTKAGERIAMVIGNSDITDITPKSPQARPCVGPDFDFELHWNLFDRGGDAYCPPASFNEGPSVSGVGTFSLTLGGGNCPPTQWP